MCDLVAWYCIYMDTRYCEYVGCGEAFDPTETANGFCSHECERLAAELEDEEWDECPCDGVTVDEDPMDAHDDNCPARAELERI